MDRSVPVDILNPTGYTEFTTPTGDSPRVPTLRWTPDRVSQGMVADYKPFSMVDGEGVRCSLYVSGCLFECPGCFNRAAWSFKYGSPYDQALEDRIINDLGESYVQGLSLVGGEPFLNTSTCLRLVQRLRRELPNKDIWAWSGFTLDYLSKYGTLGQQQLLNEVDVLVDGPFLQNQKDLTLPYRGSSNQRVLDVKRSLAAQQPVWWKSVGG